LKSSILNSTFPVCTSISRNLKPLSSSEKQKLEVSEEGQRGDTIALRPKERTLSNRH